MLDTSPPLATCRPPTWRAPAHCSTRREAVGLGGGDLAVHTWQTLGGGGIFEQSPTPPLVFRYIFSSMSRPGEGEMGLGRSNPNSNPSSNLSYGSSSEGEMKRGSKRLGEMELDAARALADFARMAKIEREGGDGGRRSRKRIRKGSQDLGVSRSEYTYLVDEDPQDNKASKAVVGARIKVEQHVELSISDTSGPSSHVSCFGRRLNQNMTEAEREARRIRRVLANRESARQTIRRRQALREELIKRVADLSLENKNMKMEKELVTKEYLSLKDRNKELKEQMAKAIKYEVEVGTEITLMSHVEKLTSPSTELSLVAPSGPSTTACAPWSSVPSDAAASYEEGGSNGTGTSRALFFASPCAWFYPFLHQTSESCLSCCQESSNRGVHFLGNHHGFRHCPEAGDNLERASLHVGSKTDVPWTETGAIEEVKNAGINLEEMPVGFDGHDTISKHDPGGVLIRSHDVENPYSDVKSEEETSIEVDRMTDQLGTIVAEKSQVAFIPPFKKLVDPSAAAAARRRRKELTKLKMKYLHGRQIRLHV